MPVHRVPKDNRLEEHVAVIEDKERIVGAVSDGDGCVLVFTETKANRKPAGKETRS